MKILVTGGAGYIGAVLVPALLSKGYKVHVLDNLMYGGDSLLGCIADPRLELNIGDISDANCVKGALQHADIIIHLAAIVGFPACKKSPELAEKVNVGGTRTINELRSKAQPIIFASTGSNYGDIEVDICTEETTLKPLTKYGETKTLSEHLLLQTENVVVLRFATAFGLSPRMRLDLLINDFVYQASHNRNLIVYEKHFMRTFIDVRDIARSFLFVIENLSKMSGQVYNVGDETMNFTKAQVAEKLREYLPFYLHYAEVGEDLDKRNYYVCYDKISRLGFKIEIDMEKGLRDLIRGVRLVSLSNRYSNI